MHGIYDVLVLVVLYPILNSDQYGKIIPYQLPSNLMEHWRPTHAIKECIASVVD